MSNWSGPCPSPETLEGLAVGQAVELATRAHVDACPHCLRRLDRIREDNAFLASFRAGGSWPGVTVLDAPSEVRVPGYDILGELYRGGQGVIFRATQRSTKRDVAIKVIRQGLFATVADRARFAREIEALGQLKHPNIVAVHDAGVAGGLHYFVMDYVDGWPLDEAVPARPVDETAPGAAASELRAVGHRGLDSDRLRWMLAIFLKVCDAVHAAHLQGVMHRDLKPSNIRVDRAGEPHVLDFGLAKSVGEIDPAMTHTGQFIGSLPWASPEQVEGGASRVDLRTDIYSLGAILYQLVTGCAPFKPGTSLRSTMEDIVHHDPPRPRTAAAAGGWRIDDDLETIILKCLSKERERRYQSARELARDIQHYLAGEVIDAKGDSAWYVLRKTAWRKRRVVVAVALPMLLFPFALFALHRSTLAVRQADLERKLRQVEAVRNTTMLEIARRLQARPGSAAESPGGRLGLRNVDAILDDLDAGTLPVSDHGVALLLAETLREQGRIVEAEGLMRRAMHMLASEQGQQHPEIGRMRAVLADLLLRRGTRMKEAEQMAELAVAELTSAFGGDGPETARGWIVLARARLAHSDVAGALDASQRALAADPDPRSIVHMRGLAALARVQAERGENTEANRVFLEALRAMLSCAHDTDARLLDVVDLGAELVERGVVPANDVLDASALPAALGDRGVPAALREVTAVLRGGADGTPRDDEVLPARRMMVALRERLLGPDHPSLGASLASAGGTAFRVAQNHDKMSPPGIEEAAALLRRAIPLQIAAHGPDSPLVGKSYEKLATCMVVLCRLREATQWFASDCELWMRQPPDLSDRYQVLIRARWTAWHATRAGEFELALRWLDRTLEVLGETLGPDDGGAALIYACQALCLAEAGRDAEAGAADARAVRILDTQSVPDDQRIECGRLLGLARLHRGCLEEARAVMEPAWQDVQPRFDHQSRLYRLEWSHSMLTYCRAIGDPARATPFAICLRDEATGDFLPGDTAAGP